jgi:hypothetical protein
MQSKEEGESPPLEQTPWSAAVPTSSMMTPTLPRYMHGLDPPASTHHSTTLVFPNPHR